jgi:hypothetical protein
MRDNREVWERDLRKEERVVAVAAAAVGGCYRAEMD